MVEFSAEGMTCIMFYLPCISSLVVPDFRSGMNTSLETGSTFSVFMHISDCFQATDRFFLTAVWKKIPGNEARKLATI